MLKQGDAVPHFTVADVTGSTVPYARLWQRQHLVLVRLAGDGGPVPPALEAALAPLAGDDIAVVITRDPVQGIPSAGVVIADRWGEIAFAAHAARSADLPLADDIAEWMRYMRVKCPECEGEAR